MPAPPPQPPHLMHLLVRAERLLARRLKTVLDAEDCTLDAWRVLMLLSDGAGHHMTEIADHAFLPAGTLTKLMDQLVDANLVYRRVDPVTAAASAPTSPPAAAPRTSASVAACRPAGTGFPRPATTTCSVSFWPAWSTRSTAGWRHPRRRCPPAPRHSARRHPTQQKVCGPAKPP
jgi:hypothetical protein